MGALAKLDISSNQTCGIFLIRGVELGTYDASGLEALAKAIGKLKELNISSNLIKAEGAKILASAIQDNGALAKLDLSNNQLGLKDGNYLTEGAAALSAALKTNSTIKELNLASNYINAEAARIFSQDIQDNGALAKLTLGESTTPATLELGMTEGNFSGAGLGPGGAIILASWIEHK